MTEQNYKTIVRDKKSKEWWLFFSYSKISSPKEILFSMHLSDAPIFEWNRLMPLGSFGIYGDVAFIYMLDLERCSLNNRGLGTKIYKEIEKFCQKFKVKRITGEVPPDFEPAIPFWKKLGFTYFKNSKPIDIPNNGQEDVINLPRYNLFKNLKITSNSHKHN